MPASADDINTALSAFEKKAINFSRIGNKALTRAVKGFRNGSFKMPPGNKKNDKLTQAWNYLNQVAAFSDVSSVKVGSKRAPLTAGVGFEKGVRALHEKVRSKNNTSQKSGDTMNYDSIEKISSGVTHNVIDDSALREKIASKMLQLHASNKDLCEQNKEHEKRAQASRILFRQAELGMTTVPNSYGEFEQKIASLVNQNLDVLEKALELTAGNEKFGELNTPDPYSFDAAATFQADVLDNR